MFSRPFCSSCVCCCITATLFARLSLLASLCSPLLACLSLLAPSCSPSGLSLSSFFPPVVYVAVSQQPSLLAPPCSPLPARPQACPLVLSFLLLCMLLYHSNPPCLPLFACPLLACLSGLSLSSLFPSVVYVAVLQQPSCRPCCGVRFLSLPLLYEKKFCSLEISE